jgi:ankyrin repeat protein
MAADPDTTDLCDLARDGRLDALRGAVAAGVDVDRRDHRGQTPLLVASKAGHVDVVRLLLDHGADAEARRRGRTVVAEAIRRYAPVDVVRVMLGVVDVRGVDDDGVSLAHLAAIRGDAEVMEAVLEAGADPLAEDAAGWTPLARAVQAGSFRSARVLVTFGASWGDGVPLELLEAVRRGKQEVVAHALDSGLDPSSQDGNGRSLLALALQAGRIELAHLLLDAGAEPVGHPDEGPLLAMQDVLQDDALFARLLEVADVDEVGGRSPRTALEHALRSARTDRVRQLVEAGAAVDATCDDGLSVLTCARDRDSMRMLIVAGADPSTLHAEHRRTLFGGPEALTEPVDPAWRLARRGTRPAEPMTNPWWVLLARTRVGASAVRGEVRDGVTSCFDRFGQSLTHLPDGRFVEVAGEHEDWYARDFFIYNDVVVWDADANPTLLGYPAEVFPPTDFHTATRVGDTLWLVGNLGYARDRRPGETQVLVLTVDTWEITAVATHGDGPGWISKHEAAWVDGEIVVWGGRVWDGEHLVDNEGRFALDVQTRRWRRA